VFSGKQGMTDIKALDGSILRIDDNSVTTVSGPYPNDPPLGPM
jgi:hypothetical protein